MIELLLQLNKGMAWPEFSFNAPSTLISESESSTYQKNQHWKVHVLDKFELYYVNKTSNETIVDHLGIIIRDQTLEICSVWYQGIKLNPYILLKMSSYDPTYRSDFIEYCKQNNITLDLGPLQQTKFWHAGRWTMNFSKDFWHQYKKFRTGDQYNNFVGDSSDDIRTNTQRLKDLL